MATNIQRDANAELSITLLQQILTELQALRRDGDRSRVTLEGVCALPFVVPEPA